jgi:hypothetical protein
MRIVRDLYLQQHRVNSPTGSRSTTSPSKEEAAALTPLQLGAEQVQVEFNVSVNAGEAAVVTVANTTMKAH